MGKNELSEELNGAVKSKERGKKPNDVLEIAAIGGFCI